MTELEQLRAELNDAKRVNRNLLGFLRVVYKYLVHPDVNALPFVRNSSSYAAQIKVYFESIGENIYD